MAQDEPALVLELSIVSTLYRSEPYIAEFYRRIVAAAEAVSAQFELVFVDDGSPDNSAAVVQELIAKDARVRLVELSKNFGHHAAMLAGLSAARGARVFLIDSDLEEPPELLGQFTEALTSGGFDAVYGVQAEERKGGFLERSSGGLFYTLFNALSDTPIPANLCTVRLMTKQYVEAILAMGEVNLFLGGQFAWVGFKQRAVPIKKTQVRVRSSYSLSRKISLFVNALSSFSSYPIKLVFGIGVLLSSISTLYSMFLILSKLLYPEQILSGWSSLMASIWFFGSFIILFLGIIGMYISKIYNEVKRRPRFIIRRVL